MPFARFVLYCATVGVLVMSGFATLLRPPSLVWAALVLAGYLALLLGGVFVLRWRVYVDAIVRGPRGARGIALTFDDGPHPSLTPRILQVLAEYHVKATFFLVGRKAEAHPEVVRSILAGGHEIGLVSYSLDRVFALRSERRVREDLEHGIAVLRAICGRSPHLFRPPFGHTTPMISRVAEMLELVVVGWTIAGRGMLEANPSGVIARVRRDLRDGAIISLHDAPEYGDHEPAAFDALPAILDAIAAAGLDVVPLAQWAFFPHGGAEGSTT